MEKHEEVLRKVYDVFSTGNLNELDNLIDRNFIEQTPDPTLPSDKKGLEYVKDLISTYRRAFPDLKVNVVEVFTKGDKLGAFLKMSGTHKGEFNGISPTNKHMEIYGFDLVKVKDGKLAEHWGVYDNLTMMMELGLISEKELFAAHH